MATPISVLLVEDSPIATTLLKRILTSSPDIVVVGTAGNGVEALELIPKLQPHVVCTDLHMPRMDGLELTRWIMTEYPRPILVISASVDQHADQQNVFQLLQAGALDVFPKPTISSLGDYEQIRHELITRIKVLSGVSVFTQRRSKLSSQPAPPASVATKPLVYPVPRQPGLLTPSPRSPAIARIHAPKVVAIGASTGGPQALHTILKALPAHFPLPILCVQHISEGFLSGLTQWLASACQLRVTIAQAGDYPKPGFIYFAPDRSHLQLSSKGTFVLAGDAPVSGHRPSVTVLFQSVATYYRQTAIGVLLTGMGRDGADGLHAIAQAGGITIAQSEESCVVFGMPKEAIDLGAVQTILSPEEISPYLVKECG